MDSCSTPRVQAPIHVAEPFGAQKWHQQGSTPSHPAQQPSGVLGCSYTTQPLLRQMTKTWCLFRTQKGPRCYPDMISRWNGELCFLCFKSKKLQ